MSALADIYLKKQTLQDLLKGIELKGLKGISITISISDDTNDYGQNCNSWISQSKDERQAKKARYYTGNGKVFWTDGTIKVAEQKGPIQGNNISSNDAPW